jgi:hypothetical protein
MECFEVGYTLRDCLGDNESTCIQCDVVGHTTEGCPKRYLEKMKLGVPYVPGAEGESHVSRAGAGAGAMKECESALEAEGDGGKGLGVL